ncbi:hypothetical protein CMUS01_01610 [Colletotrichum musicola]|uniref:Uncharacterized protein n=1 Tax=Colletotrichum musicola TaxID=2175873 RepID=A0A8H6U7V4_9PEZI|nr:hypothetical protein CMUS01_01610 [Colletotrichum musicola]
MSFKTALRLIVPDASSNTPADSWDGSSTPKPAMGDSYFGKHTQTASPRSTPQPMFMSAASPRSTPQPMPVSAAPKREYNREPPRPPKEGFE